MSVLLTGGAGFIGSHTLVELLNDGYDAVVMDNYSNSSPKALERVEELTGKKVKSYTADISDREALEKIFSENDICCFIIEVTHSFLRFCFDEFVQIFFVKIINFIPFFIEIFK